MDVRRSTAKKRAHIFTVLSAWLCIPLFGLVSLFGSLLIGTVITNVDSPELLAIRMVIITGFTGVVLLFIVSVLIWQFKKRTFFKHTLVGLGIGSVMYAVIFIGGVIGYIRMSSVSNDYSGAVCTNIRDQYMRNARSATVPIATESGYGTGFAVDDGSTIVTAYHVVENAKSIKANFLGDERPMTVISVAPEFDIALLHLEKPMEAFLKLTARYEVSDELYALGYPGNTFTAGQASLSKGILSRIIINSDLKLNANDAPNGLEMIQTDIGLNPGNSGGPIFNRCGVVGVVSMRSNTQGFAGISSEEGINYGISSKTVAERFKLMIKSE